MSKEPVVIIGTGLAGYTLAKAFREHDKESPLIMVSSHVGRFYSKPLLSTALTSKRTVVQLATADAKTMEEQLNAEIITKTQVTRIDPERKCIGMDNRSINYGKLVLACGAEVIRPPLLGDAAQEVRSVNDLEDYAIFRKVLGGKKHVGILGAGLVGCEFANDLINEGYEVDVIAPSKYPVDRLLPEEIGQVLQVALAKSGVKWHLGQLASAVNKSAEGYVLSLPNQQLKVDIVLSAIGLRPRIRLAQKAKLKINRGVVVDRYLQTSDPHIYALGDCAEVSGLVLFFIAPLRQCSGALAKTLAGNPTQVTYPAMPVSLKTPACPIVVCPPPETVEGAWHIEGDKLNLKALFYGKDEQLLGFALTGTKIRERMQLVKEMPGLFS